VAVSPFASFKHVREEFAVAVQDALPIVPQDTTRHASVLELDFVYLSGFPVVLTVAYPESQVGVVV